MSNNSFSVTKRNGKKEKFNPDKINQAVQRACEGLEDKVSVSEIITDSEFQMYDGIPTVEIDKCNILSARDKIQKEAAYSYAAARLLLDVIYQEVFGEEVDRDAFEYQYPKSFIVNLKKLVKDGRLDERLLSFDLKRLSNHIDMERDKLWKYHGIQTIYDRYLLHINKRRMETPQGFLMRVAMGLAIDEGRSKNRRAMEFYDVLSQFNFISSTPTLFNSGTTHPQLSSCYLSTVDDSISGIFGTIGEQALLSKYAGGLGFDMTPIRGMGAYIKGTNGESQGLIPWAKIFDSTLIAVNQGGKRKGAGCMYLETWHIDIEDFLELLKPTGDERRRTHDSHTANWIPDLFMERVMADEEWTLFSPDEVSDLHGLYGKDFKKRYEYYEKQAEKGDIIFRKVGAKDLWKKMLTMLYETGHPWITFKDPSNARYTNQHMGAVNSSNLCTEILLHTKPTVYDKFIQHNGSIGETAVCNLGSINLDRHIVDGSLDEKMLANTVQTAMRMLDNVVDINFYPAKEAGVSNLAHRPVGLGIMGFHTALHSLGINYDSDEAIDFADYSQELVSYHAILNSTELAKEKGKYESYEGSLWDKGKLPIDTYFDFMKKYRSDYPTYDKVRLDWSVVRKAMKENGMRNSNVMAIAPTATIASIIGVSQSIEPEYSVMYTYSTLSGEFIQVSEHFVKDMQEAGLWSPELLEAVKKVRGKISDIKGIPNKFKQKYKTSFEMPYERLVACAAVRQKWIDMGQSLNLYYDFKALKHKQPSKKHLNDIYMDAWKAGLKTTYYLRSKAASEVEQSTTKQTTQEVLSHINAEIKHVEEDVQTLANLCSIENGADCEACQ
jgi:ribonucleoside-diphosphate reductase alpha chain